MSISVNINDQVGPQLAAVNDALTRRSGLHKRMAEDVAAVLRKHFKTNNSSKANKKGWPRQNFWNRFRAVTSSGNELSGTVTIPDKDRALRHKIEGGTIRPKSGKFLLIPMTGAAYKLLGGARARDAFPDAFPVKKRDGRMFLARGSGDSLRVLARLVPSVTHAADPDALPPDQDMQAVAVQGARRYLALALARGTT
jgi:hypothetical protein